MYSNEGYLDFKKVEVSDKFMKAIDSLMKGVNKGNRIALMCTEKKPINCHRAILVANAIYKNGIDRTNKY